MLHGMRQLAWDDLRIFLAVARAGSLAGASAELNVDRSTVSRRVDALERAFGARLFLRTREGVRPSAAGERLRVHAERMEAVARAISPAALVSEKAISATVRVATTESLATFLVEQGLLGLRAAHPELVVELLGGNRPVDLSRGEAELALRTVRPEEAALVARKLTKMTFALYGAQAYLRARGTPRDVEELAGHDVVLPSAELSRLPEAQWMAARPDVRVVFRSSSMGALVRAASGGAGLVVLPRLWGDREATLERLGAVEKIPARTMWLVMHEDAARWPPVRVVADEIARIFAGTR